MVGVPIYCASHILLALFSICEGCKYRVAFCNSFIISCADKIPKNFTHSLCLCSFLYNFTDSDLSDIPPILHSIFCLDSFFKTFMVLNMTSRPLYEESEMVDRIVILLFTGLFHFFAI